MLQRRDSGVTLIELLLAVGVLAVLVGLLLPAVQKVRDAAVRTQSQNQMRQYALAMHTYATGYQGRLPVYMAFGGDVDIETTPRQPSGEPYNLLTRAGAIDVPGNYTIVSPADPTVNYKDLADRAVGRFTFTQYGGTCSYPLNGAVFADTLNPKDLTASFLDGTTNTVMVAERYANCGMLPEKEVQLTQSSWLLGGTKSISDSRRSTFADWPFYAPDIHPVRDPVTGLTVPSVRGYTFQARPSQKDCDPRNLSTPHHAMQVAMMDGSVRSVHAGVADTVFWAAVTPAGGEVGSLDD